MEIDRRGILVMAAQQMIGIEHDDEGGRGERENGAGKGNRERGEGREKEKLVGELDWNYGLSGGGSLVIRAAPLRSSFSFSLLLPSFVSSVCLSCVE